MNALIKINQGDISDDDYHWIINNCNYIAVDTETSGLDPRRNTLKLVQIAAKEQYYLVKINTESKPKNLSTLLENKSICKVFHHATFDTRFILMHLGVRIENIVCTKISAKILYGIEHQNSLKDLLQEHLGVVIDKSQQKSNWGQAELSDEQIEYAINDVKYLERLWFILREKLFETRKYELAVQCFNFIPVQALLQNDGIDNIFEH